MKRFSFKSYLVIAVAMLMAVCFMSTITYAEDQILEKKIEKVVLKKDKNGNPYAMFIVNDARNLKGVNYSTGAAVMAFSDVYAKAKTFKKGDTLRAVVAKRDYRGNPSYTVLKFIE